VYLRHGDENILFDNSRTLVELNGTRARKLRLEASYFGVGGLVDMIEAAWPKCKRCGVSKLDQNTFPHCEDQQVEKTDKTTATGSSLGLDESDTVSEGVETGKTKKSKAKTRHEPVSKKPVKHRLLPGSTVHVIPKSRIMIRRFGRNNNNNVEQEKEFSFTAKVVAIRRRSVLDNQQRIEVKTTEEGSKALVSKAIRLAQTIEPLLRWTNAS